MELCACESRQIITIEQDPCSDSRNHQVLREHKEKAPKPGWRPVLVRDGPFGFKAGVQVRQLAGPRAMSSYSGKRNHM